MKTKMIRNALFLLLFLPAIKAFAQKDSMAQAPLTNKKYVAWVSPSKATHVYGLMFNVWPKDSMPYPEINGIEFNVCPAAVFAPFLIAFYSLRVSQLMKSNNDSLPLNGFKDFKKVNGLQVGFINLEPTVINGLDISASGSFESVANGITLSCIRNDHYLMNGLTVAALANSDHRCNGVQIALLNSCEKLKGFQFGVWNKNQKRSLPFVNWCFH